MQVQTNFCISTPDLGALCAQVPFGIFYSCKNYNAVPTGTGITIKMYAKGCLKALGLLLLSPLKHQKPETADVASDVVP